MLLPLWAMGQNLIPNPGFESFTGDSVHDWLQPNGNWYHFESRMKRVKGHITMNHVNGICLLNMSPSEYMLVELSEPLQAGQTYKAGFEGYIQFKNDRNLDGIRSLGWKFLNHSKVVDTRIFYRYAADIEFDLMDQGVHNQIQQFEGTYTAKGGEQYLLIGKMQNLHTDVRKLVYDSIHLAKTTAQDQLNLEKKELIMTYMNDMMMVKSQDKAMKMMERRQKELNRIYSQRLDSVEQLYKPVLDSLRPYYPNDAVPNDVRIYMDNLYLVNTEAEFDPQTQIQEQQGFVCDQLYRFNHVVFDSDKDILKPESYIELDQLYEYLAANPDLIVQLTGHTDNTNSDEHNLQLSLQRAESCKAYLMQKGIYPDRIYTDGKGESEPVVSNDSEEGRAMNRRVEFMLVKPDAQK